MLSPVTHMDDVMESTQHAPQKLWGSQAITEAEAA